MRKRLKLPALIALCGLALLGGCDRAESLTLASETEEPNYREGQQLSKQGRNQEALNAYLKVIAKRDDTAPESHLEAGLILQRHMKDPIAAIYHFRRYLELQPNARQAVYVRGLIESARRDFARTLMGPSPLESQADRLETQDQIDRLLRENDQLKAELTALRAGVTAAPVTSRSTVSASNGPMITVPTAPAEPPPAAVDDSPVTYAPVEAAPETAPRQQERPAVQGSTRLPPTKPSAPSASQGGRRHTVSKGDTLFSLAQKYYGNRSRWRDIYDANRNLLPSQDSLRVGMELRIP
jgi:tetratricopeptide (TPR) repeat protein